MKKPLGKSPLIHSSSVEGIRREFLPAAMELEVTPASPLGRIMLWVIMSLFVFSVVWACIGRVDVIAVAEGAILPSGRVRTLQPSSLGIVTQIYVENGDVVAEGQPLVVLDSTLTGADINRIVESLRAREDRLNRLNGFVTSVSKLENAELIPVKYSDNSFPSAASDALLRMQIQAFKTADLALSQQKVARTEELAYAAAVVKRLEKVLPLMQERADAVDQLLQQSMASRMQWLELEQGLIEARGQLQAERHRVAQLRSEVTELAHRRHQLHIESSRDALTEMEQLKSEMEELQQELNKAQELNRQQVLRSPVAGVVHELRINTIGAVVQPAQPVLDVVPAGEDLIVEAWILNRDIGFVQEGQKATIKVQTFQFTRYGTVPAELIRLSSDAVIDERAGPRYLARLRLERDWMDVAGRKVPLAPGMSVTAEVATGRRRLIEFFAAPLVAAFSEAGRER